MWILSGTGMIGIDSGEKFASDHFGSSKVSRTMVCVCVCVCVCVRALSRSVVSDSFVTPWIIAHQPLLSMGIL